jgi:fucokinase
MKLICLSPAKFIHFGTTKELLSLMTEQIDEYEFLDWKPVVQSAGVEGGAYASYNSYVGQRAVIGEGAYIENSYVLDESKVGAGSILSHVKIRNVTVPGHVVLHGIPLRNGKYTARIFGVTDNPKATVQDGAAFLTSTLPRLMRALGLSDCDLWDMDQGGARDLWNAKLFPVCDSEAEAVDRAMKLYALVDESGRGQNPDFAKTSVCEDLANGMAQATDLSGRMAEELREERNAWLGASRISLCDSYNQADMEKVLFCQSDIENRIISRRFAEKLTQGTYYRDAFAIFGHRGITEAIYQSLMRDAEKMDFSEKIRIYYALAQYMKETGATFAGQNYEYPEQLCFGEIRDVVYEEAVRGLPDSRSYRIAKDEVHVELPVRVNWGGGWTDTPPYCNENGGVVINAAISLRGILPIQITVRRLPEYVVEFESQDIGVHGIVRTKEEIQACHDPYDPFALHKAALIACGIIPPGIGAAARRPREDAGALPESTLREDAEESLEQILKRLGGGIYLSTQVVGIPKGSGLGTSSILAGACVTGLFEFLGFDKSKEEIYELVLCMEQIMSTGGGWQDQVGGLTDGIKLITTKPGIRQQIQVEPVCVPERAMRELSERFALIYTGQRRLARNLLRDVVGSYIGARPESVRALSEMKPTAALMAFYLRQGDIDSFGELLNRHWELSRQLDSGCTNSCIDQIFLSCDDLISAKFLAGAGGGGFLMVLLKKGVTKAMLHDRLAAIFQDSGVDVWDCAFV